VLICRADVPDKVELDVPQVPNADWHPVPQYALVLPHQPHSEQQFPWTEPWQPNEPPQLPSELKDKPLVDVPVEAAVEAAALVVTVWNPLDV
jgi:hypothetical protein